MGGQRMSHDGIAFVIAVILLLTFAVMTVIGLREPDAAQRAPDHVDVATVDPRRGQGAR